MQPLPHTYEAVATGDPSGLVALDSGTLPQLHSAPPLQFDGPGGVWSPETLLCAGVADCFILTFRAVSRAAHLTWLRLDCRVEGVLERVDRISLFTRFTTHASLVVPKGVREDAALRLLEQSERSCLIANSLRGARTLDARVVCAEG